MRTILRFTSIVLALAFGLTVLDGSTNSAVAFCIYNKSSATIKFREFNDEIFGEDSSDSVTELPITPIGALIFPFRYLISEAKEFKGKIEPGGHACCNYKKKPCYEDFEWPKGLKKNTKQKDQAKRVSPYAMKITYLKGSKPFAACMMAAGGFLNVFDDRIDCSAVDKGGKHLATCETGYSWKSDENKPAKRNRSKWLCSPGLAFLKAYQGIFDLSFNDREILRISDPRMNYCIDKTHSKKQGAKVHFWRCNKKNHNQKFRVVRVGKKWVPIGTAKGAGELDEKDLFRLVSEDSGLCLGIAGGSRKAETAIVQSKCTKSKNLVWKRVKRNDVHFHIKAADHDLCFGIPKRYKSIAKDIPLVLQRCDHRKARWFVVW